MKRYLFIICILINLIMIINAEEVNNNYFADNYLNYDLNENYNNILKQLEDKNLYFKSKYNQIFIKDSLTSKDEVKYILLNFKNNNLIDATVVIEKNNFHQEDLLTYIEELKVIYNYKEINNNQFIFWQNPEKIIEVFTEEIDKTRSWICFHYYLKDKEVDRDSNIISLKYYSINKLYDYSIGFSLTPIALHLKMISSRIIQEKYNLIDEDNDVYKKIDTNDSMSFYPSDFSSMSFGAGFVFSYSYFYNYKSSIGVTASASLLLCPNFGLPFKFPTSYYYISTRILLKRKIGNPDKKVRFLFEPGLMFNFEIPVTPEKDLEHITDNYYKADSYYYKFEYILPDFIFTVGPTFGLGFEARRNNFSFEFLAFSDVLFGPVFNESYSNIPGPKYALTIIPIGIEVRWNYYKIKVLEK